MMLSSSSKNLEFETEQGLQTKDIFKPQDKQDLEEIPVSCPLLSDFNNRRFADCSVVAFGKTFHLHKVLLVHSPLLKERMNHEDVLLLDFTYWPMITGHSFEFALKELYTFGRFRSDINKSNMFSILVAACFLELSDLCYFCYKYILKELRGTNTLIQFIRELEDLEKTIVFTVSSNHRLLKKYHTRLHQASLGMLHYYFSLCSLTKDLSSISLPPDACDQIPTFKDHIPACLFVAQLPLKWIEKLLCSDSLPIPSEFERYQLAKQVFAVRSSSTHIDIEPLRYEIPKIEEKKEILELAEKENDSTVLEVVKTMEPGIFSVTKAFMNFFGTMKKRKLQDMDECMEIKEENGDIQKTTEPRVIKALPKTKPSFQARMNPPKLPATLSSIYENGIIYTYMNFQQLGVVKKDEIVPFNMALESYWLQAELGNVNPENDTTEIRKLPPLRFAFLFENIGAFFKRNPKPAVMPSECVIIAGTQYRILLSADSESQETERPVMRALIQKSKGKGPRVSYEIFLYDHWGCKDESYTLNPITKCDKNGEGYASEISLPIVKSENGIDACWLAVVVKF